MAAEIPQELLEMSDQQYAELGRDLVAQYGYPPPIQMARELTGLSLALIRVIEHQLGDMPDGEKANAVAICVQSMVHSAFNLGFEKGWWRRGIKEGKEPDTES